MSSQNMGRASKDRGNKTQNTTHNTKNMTAEWPKAPDGLNPKVQATAEQIRIAQIIHDANKSDDPDLQNKIDQIVELTGKSNDTAIIALHDCDNDADRAVNMLLEGTQNEGEWELSGKKKKNRQSQKQTEATPEGGKGSTSTSNNKENRAEKSERIRGDRGERNRGGDRGDRSDRGEGKSGRDDFRNRGPPRLNRGRGGNWRNKENEKNERNLEESRRERNADGKDEGRPRGGRRGRGNRGSDRGDRGNREGGGGRVRTFQNRGLSSDGFPQSMDTWTNSTAEQASDNSGRTKGANHSVGGTGNWSEIANSEDWSEEDWNESLTETKVFTPSTSVHSSIQKNDDNVPSRLSQSLDLVSLLHKQGPVSDLSATQNSIQANGATQLPPSQVSQVPSHQHSAISQGSSASQLGQNQFSLSPYAQQAAESIKAAVGIPSGLSTTVSHHPSNTNNTPYSSVFSASSHNQQQVAQQSLSLDLQSQGNNAATTLQHMQQQANVVAMAKNNPALSQRPKPQRPRIPPPSKIPESAVEMPDDGITALDVQFGALEFGTDSSPFDFTGLSDSVASFQDSVSTNMLNSQLPVGHANNAPITSSIPITLTSTLSKDSSSGYGLNSSVQSSHISKDLSQNASSSITGPSQKVSAPDTMMMSSQSERKNVPGPTYGSQRTSQSTAVDGPYSGQKSSLLGSTGMNSNSSNYSHQSSSLTPMDNLSNVNNQSQTSYMSNTHNSSGGTYGMQPSTAYSGSVQTTGSYQPQSGYTTSYTYPTQQGYTSNANHSLSNSSSKLNSSLNHVDPQQNTSQLSYDSSSGGNLSTTMVSAANNSVGGLGGTNLGGSSSLGGLVATSSSTITTSVLKNSVPATGKPQPNIPPGVPAAAATPAMMSHHPYIMSQAAGLPFYGLQPTIYNIEDMQMMQSRLGYYDMQYSAPTSLTGRDPSMASVAYTDVKFSRTDSDASSVATTLSQGQNATQTHGQTFLNAAPALHPGYGYYFPGGMMPGSIPHYAPPLFQVPPATNAHGASSNTQYQKATAYGSHSYGSGTGTTPDLSNSIYSKSHQPLAKAAGPIGNSSTPYAPTPFIPLLAHGQPHSINLHHHMQDSPQSGAGAHSGGPQRSQQTMGQPKGPASSKQSYPFWNSN